MAVAWGDSWRQFFGEIPFIGGWLVDWIDRADNGTKALLHQEPGQNFLGEVAGTVAQNLSSAGILRDNEPAIAPKKEKLGNSGVQIALAKTPDTQDLTQQFTPEELANLTQIRDKLRDKYGVAFQANDLAQDAPGISYTGLARSKAMNTDSPSL